MAIYSFSIFGENYVYKNAISNLFFPYKKCVTEKRTLLIGSMPSLLTVLLSLPFNEVPKNEPRDDWAPAEEAEHFLKALEHLQLKVGH